MPLKHFYKIFYPVFFISGACSLVYEIIWIKMFIPLFGIGLYSASAVVASFMAGLALGSYICGKVIDNKKNPLKYYALFEFSIGVYAVILPLLIKASYMAMPFFYHNISSDFYIYGIFRGVIAFILLVIPCSLMGAALPAMSRFLVINSNGNIGKDFSLLYALNTLGSALGCLFISLFMLERFGIRGSSYFIAGLNVTIGTFAYIYSRNLKFDYAGPPAVPDAEPCAKARSLLIPVFLSGFCALSFEILWLKVLVNFVYNDAYLYPVAIMIILFGNALGSLLFFILGKKNKNYLGITAIAAIVAWFMIIISLVWFPLGLEKEIFGWRRWILCLSVVFPASFFMGITFPGLVALYSSEIKSIGRDIGNVYCVNILGAVLGSFFTGFVFIPFLGLRNTLFYCLSIYILISVLLIYRLMKRGRLAYLFSGILFLTMVLLTNKFVPPDLFKNIFIKSARVEKGELVFYKEGLVSSIGVFRYGDVISMRYSGKVKIDSTSRLDGERLKNFRLKAYIPMLLHQDPRKIINIGYGTGVRAYALTLQESIEKIDNVEICAEVFEAAPFFLNANKAKVFNNPKMINTVADGRQFLSLTKEKYDIIYIYPSIPVLSDGTIYLYTKEFLRLCKSKLNPGGVVSLYFPVNALRKDNSLVLLKTFLEVFPYAGIWSTKPAASYDRISGDGFLVGGGSKEASQLSWDYLEARFGSLTSEVKAELGYSGITGAKDLLKYYIAGTDKLKELCADENEIATDDHTIVDYRTAGRLWY